MLVRFPVVVLPTVFLFVCSIFLPPFVGLLPFSKDTDNGSHSIGINKYGVNGGLHYSMWRDTACGRALLHSLYWLTYLQLGVPENMRETDTTQIENNDTLSTERPVINYNSPIFGTQPLTTTGAPKIAVSEG
ncbi:unnamed protein product [Cylicostephanus goldi]|uniref:Uncharacterized protein n=1 Tax=Cylicostephanus goldi TaxID=71465 RepID=A0A3P6SAM7_CYLGO|nr:unnamed protein product [Cylicostephanus goldi]